MLDRLDRSFVAQRRFSAQVSHELRTPLAVVRSEADILLAEGESEASRATAENIKSATLRAERIISALLALGRAESGRIDHSVIELVEREDEDPERVVARVHLPTGDTSQRDDEPAAATSPAASSSFVTDVA
jgi:signal transduction histidine kinase